MPMRLPMIYLTPYTICLHLIQIDITAVVDIEMELDGKEIPMSG